MATDRSITVYVDSGEDAEDVASLLRRLLAHADDAGTCTPTFGAVSAGARTDNVKVQVGSGGTNTWSASLLVDSAVTQQRWMNLIRDIFNSCLQITSSCTLTTAAAYAAGGRTDSVTLTIAA